jgi:cytidylate kinase
MRRVVTIDGPAGSGKSTAARLLAGRLGWSLLDTGAMFRAVTLAAHRDGLDPSDSDALGDLADRLRVEFPPGLVLLDGQDVTGQIRTVQVTRDSRHAAENPRVRARLIEWQRSFAGLQPTVTEGRDQGTIVFPDAPCKFFLTAEPLVRAQRRQAEHARRGEAITVEQVLADQEERDSRDRQRAIAPLKAADDAMAVDTSGLEIEQVVDLLEQVVRERLGEATGVR